MRFRLLKRRMDARSAGFFLVFLAFSWIMREGRYCRWNELNSLSAPPRINEQKQIGPRHEEPRSLFDCLNIAACFSVIALHCNQMVHTWQPGKNWLLALLIEVLFYWVVPVFLMLTGATFMRYRDRYDTKTFLSKRIKRTVIPLTTSRSAPVASRSHLLLNKLKTR